MEDKDADGLIVPVEDGLPEELALLLGEDRGTEELPLLPVEERGTDELIGAVETPMVEVPENGGDPVELAVKPDDDCGEDVAGLPDDDD